MLSWMRGWGGPVAGVEPLILNHLERCEIFGCGAKAWVRAYFDADLFAQYCGHHASEKTAAFWAGAIYVIDERVHILGAN